MTQIFPHGIGLVAASKLENDKFAMQVILRDCWTGEYRSDV